MLLLSYVLIGLAVAGGITLLLPRRICLWLASIALFFGMGLPMLAWGYASYFVHGDTSGYGMLGTLCVILFAPAGVFLGLVGLLKSD